MPADAPAPGGAVAHGLAPGEQQEAEQSVAHLGAEREAANSYQNRMQPLLSAQAALADAKTGAGTDTLNRVRQLVGTFTPDQLSGVRSFIGLGSAHGDASFDEARKYLTNYAANTPGANRSDSGAATAAHANASVEISPDAAKQVIKAAIGMERMRQAQVLEFQSDPGRTGAQYDRFQADMATKADPRAFMADQQSPAERAALLGGMNASQRTNYLASLRLGMKHGLVSLPAATPASAAPPQPSVSRGY